KTDQAAVLVNLGAISQDQGDYEEARAHLEESLVLFRAAGGKRGVAWALEGLGMAALAQGDAKGAHALHLESLAIRRELGEDSNIACSLLHLADVAIIE